MGAAGKYTEFDAEPGSSHNLIVGLVPPGASVLEFGCATGYMSEVLKTRLGCSVVGVELSPEAGEMARQHCDRVIIGDAETLDFGELLGQQRFNIIIFADVLEHLRQPATVLCRIRPFLSEGGAIIASIPNIAHGSVRLALLGGEFRYRDTGLLDDTHLRFFTRESVQDLFEGAGYIVTHWLRRRKAITESEIAVPGSVPEAVHDWLAKDQEATTYQFIVRAGPASAELLGQLRTALAAATGELESLKRKQRMDLTRQEIADLIPPGEIFILVDDEQWDPGEIIGGRHRLSFLERDGQYWGPPADDDTAIKELEQLRQAGAAFILFGRPAFWWLEYYARLHRHLRSNFRCVLENDRLVVFDLHAQAH